MESPFNLKDSRRFPISTKLSCTFASISKCCELDFLIDTAPNYSPSMAQLVLAHASCMRMPETYNTKKYTQTPKESLVDIGKRLPLLRIKETVRFDMGRVYLNTSNIVSMRALVYALLDEVLSSLVTYARLMERKRLEY